MKVFRRWVFPEDLALPRERDAWILALPKRDRVRDTDTEVVVLIATDFDALVEERDRYREALETIASSYYHREYELRKMARAALSNDTEDS